MIFITSMLVASCADNLTFTPKEDMFPEAKVGRFYYAEITAKYDAGEVFYFLKNNTKIRITPAGTGLATTPEFGNKANSKYYDKIIISGVPKEEGEALILIHTMIYPTRYTPGKYFNKKIKINITKE
ncbi:hypothetical protein QDZ74_000408 [Pluralibacter gergoviae]|uniref:hypothetical protein n=2 Tax=Pluralibacter gergoviae TaxID=61647 RepID=UPI0011138904|nr:hypothetical protein [Pluralibacter gergoviae]EKW6616850.1 hypothetical protein [Pluralibacter gergoviae]ELD4301572.1 hypothetical protein [Pluralibacter gergoviae]ELO7479012.1 hypothetical protein [Pluralibacter gergoviae]ELW9441060.1 hypothetical protein [Pluralibacter gergoviae]